MSGSRRQRGRTLSLLLFLVCAILLLCVPAAQAQAQEKEWRVTGMEVRLDVQPNGDVLVQETVGFRFEGSFSFVGRVIPAGNVSLSDFAVSQNGVPLPQGSGPGTWEVFDEGDNKVVQLNFALSDTTESWTISYRARDAIQFFDQGDELRWYLFDAQTPVPTDQVEATVTLPAPVASDRLTGAIQTGLGVSRSYESPAESTMVFTGSGVPPYTEFWIVTGFPKDVVQFNWTARRLAAFALPRAGFLLPILSIVGMLIIWSRRGRDDPQRAYAKYLTEPPSDLSPGLAGALLDERVDVKEVVATIIDLARRGYLEMEEQREGVWIFGRNVTTFRRLRPLDELSGFERQVADALFSKDPNEVTSEELKNRFYAHVGPICAEVYREVTRRKFFTDNPDTTRSYWMVVGIGIGLVLAGLTALAAVLDVGGWAFFAIGSGIAVIVIMLFARFMPQRTPLGAQEQRKWEAFRNYLQDLDRFQDLPDAQAKFERYLPYGVAFGVEREWVRRFSELKVPGPQWYRPVFIPQAGWPHGPGMPGEGQALPTGLPESGIPGSPGGGLPGGLSGGGFSLDTISDSLFSSLNNMSSVLTSRPSSTGSGRGAFGGGGGFGGGFSGGGGGGGFRAG